MHNKLYHIKKLLYHFIDFFYPPICLVCGDKINLNYKIKPDNNPTPDTNPYIMDTEFCCSRCKSQVTFAGNKYEVIADIIPNYDTDNFAIANAISLFKNTKNLPIINLIYALKYKGFKRIGIEYGEWLGKILLQENMKDYDYIVPVPIHFARIRERGFNQSDCISMGINKIMNAEIIFDLLKRNKNTLSQTQITQTERLKNMENVFVLNKKYNAANKKHNIKYNIQGKKILLVDDVLTTGSTLNSCALVLLENKVKQVDIATLLS